jgi:hypothetical protein
MEDPHAQQNVSLQTGMHDTTSKYKQVMYEEDSLIESERSVSARQQQQQKEAEEPFVVFNFVGEEPLKAPLSVVATNAVLGAMFTCGFRESTSFHVSIPNYSRATFSMVLRAIEGLPVRPESCTVSELVTLIKAANQYSVTGLMNTCLKSLAVRPWDFSLEREKYQFMEFILEYELGEKFFNKASRIKVSGDFVDLSSPLTCAARYGCPLLLRYYLERQEKRKWTPAELTSALYLALKNNHPECVRTLLLCSGNTFSGTLAWTVDGRHRWGTIMKMAIECKTGIEVIRALVEEFNTVPDIPELVQAFETRLSEDVLAYLLGYKCRSREEMEANLAFHHAKWIVCVRNSYYELLLILEKQGYLPFFINLHLDHKYSIPDTAKGDTFLMVALRLGDLPLTKWLIDHGARIDIVNGLGETPLHVAAEVGDVALVCLLLKQGASPGVCAQGATPLHRARNAPKEVSQAAHQRLGDRGLLERMLSEAYLAAGVPQSSLGAQLLRLLCN